MSKKQMINKSLVAGVLCLSMQAVLAAGCVSWPASTFSPVPDAHNHISPDEGIYWYNTNQNNTQASQSLMPACKTDNPIQKARCMKNLESKGYFDPNKPTIIFFQGWQPGSVKNKSRFDFCYSYPQQNQQMSTPYNVLQYWKGWNVGTFYWNQFGDEPNVIDAEAKIYSTQGRQGMRWHYQDSQTGQLSYCDAASLHCHMPQNALSQPEDVLQMATQAFRQAMPSRLNYKGSELRISGQSLGTQIAIGVTQSILQNKWLPQPTRLTLLDPYFSPDSVFNFSEHLPYSVAGYNAKIIANIRQNLAPNLPIDVYRTSDLSFSPTGNPAPALMKQVAFMRLYPQYLTAVHGLAQQAALHVSSIYLYFISKKSLPSTIKSVDGVATSPYVNAESSNQAVLANMGQARYQLSTIAEKVDTDTQAEAFTSVKPYQVRSNAQSFMSLSQIYCLGDYLDGLT